MESAKQPQSNVSQSTEKDEEMVTNTDAHYSKIPRLLKSRKSSLKDGTERPASAKTVDHLECKFKSTVVKFNKELREINTLNEKLSNIMESLIRIRDELEEKGQKELPDLPDFSSLTHIKSVTLAKSQSRISCQRQKLIKKIIKENKVSDVIKESADDVKSRQTLEAGVIDIASQMPSLQFKLTELEDLLSKAHEKQDQLESNLSSNQTGIKYIMEYVEQVLAVKKHSQNLTQELDNASTALQREKDKHTRELSAKDSELLMLRSNLEDELSKRIALEEALEKLKLASSNNPEKERLEHCIEQMLSTHTASNSGRQEMAIENNNLKYQLEELKNQMAASEEDRINLVQEDIRNKNRIQSLEQFNQDLLADFASVCQRNLFERESQIFAIKNKMESLVDLKNSLVSQDAGGEPYISLSVLVNISDVRTLKKEIVNLHKRLMDMEDAREELESIISSKNAKIKELENDLSSKYLEIELMEGVLETMKDREKGNSLLLEKIEFSSGFLSEQESHGDNGEKLKELVNWQDKKRGLVAELESKLKASEERYSLAEERRIRNEERIAILQVKLAQYQQAAR